MKKLITLLTVVLIGCAAAQVPSSPDGWNAATAGTTAVFKANFLANEQIAFELNALNEIEIEANKVEDGAVFNFVLPVNNKTGRPIEVTGSVFQFGGSSTPYYTFTNPSVIALNGDASGYLVITLTFGTVPDSIKAKGANIRFTTNVRAVATDIGTGNFGEEFNLY